MDQVRDIPNGEPDRQFPDDAPRGADMMAPGAFAGYLHNSRRTAEPPKPRKTRRKVLSRVRHFSDRYDEWKLGVSTWFDRMEMAPDLAENIGSPRWFRGLLTMVGLGAVALMFWPDLTPLEARAAVPQDSAIQQEYRAYSISPLALGADTGKRMGPTDAVIPLKSAPERPRIEMIATLAPGDSFASMLRRAGAAPSDISRVSELVGQAVPLGEIEAGTKMDIVLGRRPGEGERRPIDALSFRARFDLQLKVDREGRDEFGNPVGALALERSVIRVDETPLRVRGKVGSSLYRSMRAAGVPASAVQDYLKVLDAQIDMDREVRGSDEFDIILAYRRAATGERQAGKLLYAGVERDGKARTQMMRWGSEGRFYEASGVGEQRTGLARPVPGAVSSKYGMRRHPILGYRRMHAGMDFRARRGTPIVAVSDGRVISAGRSGGCGIAVKLQHGGNLQTRYCHMSRMAVRRGANVRRGQVIGYVGSTGLSTGPHLHYEMYRGGRSINPASVKFVTRAVLSGTELLDFKRQLITLENIEVGAALQDLEPMREEIDEPKREIEKIGVTALAR